MKNTVEGYQRELKSKLFYAQLDHIIKSHLKKAFKSIKFVKRTKTVVRYYEPQNHILSVLEDKSFPQITNEIFDNDYEKYV